MARAHGVDHGNGRIVLVIAGEDYLVARIVDLEKALEVFLELRLKAVHRLEQRNERQLVIRQ